MSCTYISYFIAELIRGIIIPQAATLSIFRTRSVDVHLPGNSDSITILKILSLLYLKYCPHTKYSNEQFVRATLLKLLHGLF